MGKRALLSKYGRGDNVAWIEAHQSLLNHRKTNRAIALLKCDRHKFIGHMFQLWWWCLDNAPDGKFGDLLPGEIAVAAGWPIKTGDAFVKALIASGFFDEDGDDDGLRLHDWSDYTGRLMAKREAGRKGGVASGESRRELKQTDVLLEANDASALTPTNQPTSPPLPTQPTKPTSPTRVNVRTALDLSPTEVALVLRACPNAAVNARWIEWVSWIEEERERGRDRMPDDKVAAFIGWLKKDDGRQGSAAPTITAAFAR